MRSLNADQSGEKESRQPDLNSETLQCSFAGPIDAVLARSALIEAGYASSQLSLTIIQEEASQPEPMRVKPGREAGFMRRILRFFTAKPRHGGYGLEQPISDAPEILQEPSHASPGAELVLSISGVRSLEMVISILTAHNGNVFPQQTSPEELFL